jgi:hypothetical protein
VESAKRLLGELEQHAESARRALGRDNGAEFFAAVEERERLLRELDEVVTALAHEHAMAVEGEGRDFETSTLLAETAQIAARALESHNQLQTATRQERDRLGASIEANNRPDAIASQYAVATSAPAVRSLSVTG